MNKICLASVGVLLSFVVCDTALTQSQSDLALIRWPIFVEGGDTTWKLTFDYAWDEWGTQLFVDQVSAAQGCIMTPSYELWSGVSFHLDNGWNRMLYEECLEDWIRAYGERGSGTGEMLWPTKLDAHALVSESGWSSYYYIYVADASNNRVIELRYNWESQSMEWLNSITGGGLYLPKDLDINNGGTFLHNDDDYLWVLNGSQIKRFTLDGILRNTYGESGCDPGGIGNFCRPTAVACGRSDQIDEPPYDKYANNNRVYVADDANHRIVLLDKEPSSEDLNWVKAVSLPIDSRITDLEVDNFGQVWAADWQNGRMYKYTYDLYPLCYFGSFGTGKDQFYYPKSISVTGGYLGVGNVYVVESWTSSSGAQHFLLGTDMVDFQIASSVDGGWHFITYTLVDNSDVSIEIYNEGGILVKTLFYAMECSGPCIHIWDGSYESGGYVPSGNYRIVVTDSSRYRRIDDWEPVNVVVKESWLHHESHPLYPPWDLTGYEFGTDQILVCWNYPGYLGHWFTVYCDGCLCGAVPPEASRCYLDSALIPDRSYIYWVRSYSGGLYSEPSNADTVTLQSKLSPVRPDPSLWIEPELSEPLGPPKKEDSVDVAIIWTPVYPGKLAQVEVILKSWQALQGFELLIKPRSDADLSLFDFHTESISTDSALIGTDWVQYPVRECAIDTAGSVISGFQSVTCRGQVADTSLGHCKYLWVKGWAPAGEPIPPSGVWRTFFKFAVDAGCISDTVTERWVVFDLPFCTLYDPYDNEVPVRRWQGELSLNLGVAGDANADSLVDLGDVVYLLGYLYQHGPPPCIPESGDANGDCLPELADVCQLLGYLYRGGPPPKPGCWHGE